MADITIGDYKYFIYSDSSYSGVYVQAVDKTKTSYEDIPSTITYSGTTYSVKHAKYCFRDCVNLISAPTIPNSVTDMIECFYGCTSLIDPPVLPNNVESLTSCFYNCEKLTAGPNIPSSVSYFNQCFYGCTSLIDPPILSNDTPIVSMLDSFSGCTSLRTPPIIPSRVDLMTSCFRDCRSLTSPPIIPNGTTGLKYCFYGCIGLTSAPTIPNSVTNMSGTFQNCTGLTTAPEIPSNVTNMNSCFDGCTGLTSAPTIPNGVTDMGYCFRNCTSLTAAPEIPSSVTNMIVCFSGCTGLTTAPTIPNGVTNLYFCFDGCSSLTAAPEIPSGVTNMSATFQNCTGLTTAPEIPSSVSIMTSCFSGCSSLTAAPVIPSGVTLMTSCFYGCSSLTAAPEIPSGVTNMSSCFSGCTRLTTAPEIPSSVTGMRSCFYNCPRLTGDFFVNNNPNVYDYIFTHTTESIRIVPRYSTISQEGIAKWTVIADAYNNVTIFVPSLSFQTLSTYRVDSSGSTTLVEEGSYVLLEAVYAFVGLTGDVVTKAVKSNGVTISPTWSETTTDGVTTARAWVHQDVDDQAIYAVTLSDIYNHAETRSFTVTRVEALLDFLNGNQGMGLAIGTIATQPGFHCALKSQFEDDLVAPDMTSEELSDFLEDLNPGGTQPSVIRTIHTEVVTASINKAFANYVSVTAPAVENYRFLCWSEVSTREWVGSVYPEYTTRQTTNMWNATSGQSGTGTIDCTALYVPLYYATTTSEADKVDFIVEQGTSGIWTYRKWDSGIAECWGNNLVTTSFGNTFGALYYGTFSVDLPSGLFTSVTSATATRGANGGHGNGLAWISLNYVGTNRLGAYIIDSVAQTLTFGFSYNVKGRWK